MGAVGGGGEVGAEGEDGIGLLCLESHQLFMSVPHLDQYRPTTQALSRQSPKHPLRRSKEGRRRSCSAHRSCVSTLSSRQVTTSYCWVLNFSPSDMGCERDLAAPRKEYIGRYGDAGNRVLQGVGDRRHCVVLHHPGSALPASTFSRFNCMTRHR